MRKFNIRTSLGAALNSMVARMTGGGQSQPQASIPIAPGPPNIPPPYVNLAPKPKLFTKRRAKEQTIQSLRSRGQWDPNQKQTRKNRRRASAAGDRHAFRK